MNTSSNLKITGEFKIFKQTAYGEYKLLQTSKNLITDSGLDAPASQSRLWANCFLYLVAGTGTTPATFSDTALANQVLQTNTYSTIIPSSMEVTTSFIKMRRSFNLTNNTGSAKTITELGTKPSSVSNVFSRTLLSPSFTMQNGETVVCVYELTLNFPGNTTSSFSLITSPQVPTNTAAIVACPIVGINTDGTTISVYNGQPSATAVSSALAFEPSATSDNVFRFATANITNFTAARNDYLAYPSRYYYGQTYLGGPSSIGFVSSYNAGPVVDSYTSGSFQVRRSVIVPPNTLSTIRGFNVGTSWNSGFDYYKDSAGLFCLFDSAYTIPTNHYFKLAHILKWSR